jgi:serine/threonine protein phosphatase PrpC
VKPLRCPRCDADALADDEFCETCGADVGRRRDTRRAHVEIDLGVAAAVSDVGLVHRRNDDAACISLTGGRLVAVVCDGVSSSAGAPVAAEVAAGATCAALADPVAGMVDAVRTAGDDVAALAWSGERAGDPPSCTMVAATIDRSTITIGWAGDSRAYWLTGDDVVRLTRDHSWAGEQVEAGAMTADQAMADGRAHAITRWLGSDQPAGEPAVTTFTPSAGGHLLLCTDGLWNELAADHELLTLVRDAGPRPLDIAVALTRMALTRGGRDNVTVAVAEVTLD